MQNNINEISKLAKVAKSTVSKALNGQKGVSEEKRQEIIKIAECYGYKPNSIARALAQHRTDTIGILIPEDASYTLTGIYWSEIIASVAEESDKHGYNLMLIIPNKENPFEKIQNIVQKRCVDGLIVPAEQLNAKELKLLTQEGIPFVLQGRSSLTDHYCVDVRNEQGAEDLTSTLISKNYKKIGCISGMENFLYTKERISGFKKIMDSNGLQSDIIMHTLYSEEETKKNVRLFLRNNPDLDAIFITAGGEFLLYIIDVVKEENFNLEKFGIAVFDDYKPFHYLPFNIIAAKQPIKQMGSQCARILFQLIKKEDPPKLSLFDINIV